MALDPADYNVQELRDEISEIDDADDIEAILEAERDGGDRKTAKRRLEARLNALRSEGAESGAEGEEGEDDPENAADDAGDEPAQEPAEEPEEPEEAADEGEEAAPDRTYPPASSDELVVFDPIGAGDTGRAGPPHAGHDTIHLANDGNEPVCGASIGAKAQNAVRSDLPEGVDECQRCLD